MNRFRTAASMCGLLTLVTLVVLFLVLTSVAVRGAEASLNGCMDATCRITTPERMLPNGQRGSDRGSGCAFQRVAGSIWILTNAHVVAESTVVQCEFWQQGHQSDPLPGRVIAKDSGLDVAIVEVPEAAFGGRPPAIVPLAEATDFPRPNDTIISVGCANGAWATGWKGHVLGYQDSDMHFVPPPANGRSGSAVFNAQGTKIVGLVRARIDASGQGIAIGITALRSQMAATCSRVGAAQPLAAIRPVARASGATVSSMEQGGCGPGGCGPGGCDALKYRFLPYRQLQDRQQQERQQTPQTLPGGNPWPTLPVPAPSVPPPDLAPIQQQLGRISDSLEDIRREAKPIPAPTPGSPLTTQPAGPDPAVAAAFNMAQQAAEATAATKKKVDELETATIAAKAGQEKIAGEVRTIADSHGKLAEMVAKHGTLAERFEARKAEVDAKLGDHAGKLEKVHEFARSLVEDKIGALKEGHGDTRLIILIVVLAVVGVFVVGVVKDVTHRRETGDPLVIEKLAARLAGKATARPWLAPAANLVGHAAHDVTSWVNQIDQRILAHKQAEAIATAAAATTPVPSATIQPTAAATPSAIA